MPLIPSHPRSVQQLGEGASALNRTQQGGCFGLFPYAGTVLAEIPLGSSLQLRTALGQFPLSVELLPTLNWK